MEGRTILEAGCGAGRFTEVLAATGATVYSFDLSRAVEANYRNNGHHKNVVIFQADIYDIPLPARSFDLILCLGVLQHCPDPKGAFLNLCRHLAPQGEIVIDVYHKHFHPIYLIRNITKRLPPALLYKAISISVPLLLPLKWHMKRVPKVGQSFARLIPLYDYKGTYPLNRRLLTAWSVLDTFDGLSPKHTHPQTLQEIRKWFREADLTNVHVSYGLNGITGRGTAVEASAERRKRTSADFHGEQN
jgi:SAM-dependent methyltransferase